MDLSKAFLMLPIGLDVLDLPRSRSHEILIQITKGQVLVFKHAIAVFEPVDMPKQVFMLRE